jgi:hypothetical protein
MSDFHENSLITFCGDFIYAVFPKGISKHGTYWWKFIYVTQYEYNLADFHEIRN